MDKPKIILRKNLYYSKVKENLLAVNINNLISSSEDSDASEVYMPSEISHLLAKLTLDTRIYVGSSRLFRVYCPKNIKAVSVVVIENLSNEEIIRQEFASGTCQLLNYLLSQNFNYINFRSPSNSSVAGLDEFLSLPLKSLSQSGAEYVGKSLKHLTPHMLLSTPSEMFWDSVPLPMKTFEEQGSKFIFSNHQYELPDNDPTHLLALDCEMVNTGDENDLDLARVSIVRCNPSFDLTTVASKKQWISMSNSPCDVVYDEFVKPTKRIVDYLTKYSGITKETLENVTKNIDNVHVDLKNIIQPNTILVGHSIQMDLKALKLYHPYIIDTSTIYNLSGDIIRKPALKKLSTEILKEEIQSKGKGHNSIEDAHCALKLAVVKLTKDLSFANKMRFTHSPTSAKDGWKPVTVIVNGRVDPTVIINENKTTFEKCQIDFTATKFVSDPNVQCIADKFIMLNEQPEIAYLNDLLHAAKLSMQLVINCQGFVAKNLRYSACQSIFNVSSDGDVITTTNELLKSHDVVISVLSDFADVSGSTSVSDKQHRLLLIQNGIESLIESTSANSAILIIFPGEHQKESTGKMFWKIL